MDLNLPLSRQSLEMQLLLYACQSLINEEALQLLVTIVHEDLDWHEVQQEANIHGISPILFQALNKIAQKNLVHSQLLHSLRSNYLQTSYQNLNLLMQLNALLKAFNANGIKTILLKGIDLVETLYKNVALRPMSDIDLLVRREDKGQIDEVLDGLGYKPEPLSMWCYAKYFETKYCHRTNAPLDIHWSLLPSEALSARFLSSINLAAWRHSIAISVDGQKALSLPKELHLLFLSLHSERHFRKAIRLLWVCDIALFLKMNNDLIDWSYFSKLAIDSCYSESIYEVFLFAKHAMGLEYKITINRNIKRYNFSRIGPNNYKDIPELLSKRITKRILDTPGLFNKPITLFRYLFPGDAFIANKYGVKSGNVPILLHFYHPFLLIWRGVKELRRLC